MPLAVLVGGSSAVVVVPVYTPPPLIPPFVPVPANTPPPLKFDIDLTADDVTLGPNRDVAIVAGGAMVSQRVSLRLKAATGTYLGDPAYGAGLSSYIGNPLTPVEQDDIAAVVTAQALMEPLVNAVGTIVVRMSVDGLTLTITGDLGVVNTDATAPLVAVITA